ncbi:MAG: hypothetical protein Q7T59_01525, partial [Candidatus Woesebacteria bacterium]|nr:hypothetical protein [Candidatus Woesebacteria bacterium]
MGDQTTFTAVKSDPYLSPGTTTDLLNYSEERWCNVWGTVCVTNTAADANGNSYRYPDGEYSFRSGSSTTTNPHYFRILPTEHCTDETQTTCTASSTPTTIAGVTYATPGTVRWCKYTGGGTMDYAAIDYTDCQAKRTGQYQYPKYLGFTSPGGVPTTSYATITINATPVASDKITSVTVGATNLIPGVTTLTGFTSTTAAARALAHHISNLNQGYIACSGSGTTAVGASSVTNPPGCNRNGSAFRLTVPSPGSAPSNRVYIIPTTGVGSLTPATGTATNSPTLPAPVVTGIPAVIATKAAGSITIGDSGSDRGVRISRVDIGSGPPTTVFTGATLDEAGTNSAGEQSSLANKVRDAINSGGSGYVATTAGGNVVSIEAPATGTTYNGKAIAVYTSQQAIGSITINDSLSDDPVRISRVDI